VAVTAPTGHAVTKPLDMTVAMLGLELDRRWRPVNVFCGVL
jgi:hypothetical protein